jgi:hypothetical protein
MGTKIDVQGDGKLCQLKDLKDLKDRKCIKVEEVWIKFERLRKVVNLSQKFNTMDKIINIGLWLPNSLLLQIQPTTPI